MLALFLKKHIEEKLGPAERQLWAQDNIERGLLG